MTDCGFCGVSMDMRTDLHRCVVVDIELAEHGPKPAQAQEFADSSAVEIGRNYDPLYFEEVSTLCQTCAHLLSTLLNHRNRQDNRCDLCGRHTGDIRAVKCDLLNELQKVGEVCPYCVGHLVGIFYGDTKYGPEVHNLPVIETGLRKNEFNGAVEISDNEEQCVYAIEGYTNRVKIGIAKNPKNRLNGLQTGSPAKLSLIAARQTPHAPRVESYLHKKYSEERIRGEWFRLSDEAIHELIETINEARGLVNEVVEE